MASAPLLLRSRSNRDRSGRCTDNSNCAVPRNMHRIFRFHCILGFIIDQQRLSFCSASWSIRPISTASLTAIPVIMLVSTKCCVRATRHHNIVHRRPVPGLESIGLQLLSMRQSTCWFQVLPPSGALRPLSWIVDPQVLHLDVSAPPSSSL